MSDKDVSGTLRMYFLGESNIPVITDSEDRVVSMDSGEATEELMVAPPAEYFCSGISCVRGEDQPQALREFVLDDIDPAKLKRGPHAPGDKVYITSRAIDYQPGQCLLAPFVKPSVVREVHDFSVSDLQKMLEESTRSACDYEKKSADIAAEYALKIAAIKHEMDQKIERLDQPAKLADLVFNYASGVRKKSF